MGSLPASVVQPRVLRVGGSSQKNEAQPVCRDPLLLPWQVPAPLWQLQDEVENPGLRNFTHLQPLELPQPCGVRNMVSIPYSRGLLSPWAHCIPVGTCPT